MNCSEAQHLIHLDAGSDLRADDRQRLLVHAESCPDCRMYRDRMSAAMRALVSLRDPETGESGGAGRGSAWPAVLREIRRRKATVAGTRRFNLSVVALSVCSLSLAVVTMVQTLSAMRAGSGVLSSGPSPVISIPAGLSFRNETPEPATGVLPGPAAAGRTAEEENSKRDDRPIRIPSAPNF